MHGSGCLAVVGVGPVLYVMYKLYFVDDYMAACALNLCSTLYDFGVV